MPCLGLNSQKKEVSHIASLHYYIYEEKKIISKTSLITKEKSRIVASKSLSSSISSCKNKSEIRRSMFKKK
jgi:hypothetical protein